MRRWYVAAPTDATARILACAHILQQVAYLRSKVVVEITIDNHIPREENQSIQSIHLSRNSGFETRSHFRTVVTSPAFLPERVPYGCEFSPIAGRFWPRVTPLDAGAFLYLLPERANS